MTINVFCPYSICFPIKCIHFYDLNGNLTQDLNKGITGVTYNLLNLPQSVAISNTLGQTTNTYIEGGAYYFYLTDHLGNNRVVANASGGIVQTSHYYPFGMSFAEGVTTSGQPYKYNGKELDTERGLNLYDYSARLMDPALGRFSTMDPLAEKYYGASPYAYVGNNPIVRIDPTGLAWFYYSLDGKSDPTWNWRDGDTYNTGVKDTNGKDFILKGVEAIVVFNGSREEKLGKGDNIKGEGAVTASVMVYGPDGADDIHKYRGFTMTSNAAKFGPIDEGLYNANYDSKGKSGSLKSNWVLNNRGPVRMLDGKINPNAPDQLSSDGEGYKDGIFIHSTNRSGFAGGRVSTGCLLIHPDDWSGFNDVMYGVKNFKVQVIRQVIMKGPIQGATGVVPRIYAPKWVTKKD
ncbi:MAG: hypothetical protein H6Q13_2472 [Bacteroidetes bacterium]|nr:hypothetical protein [Bacteroidota bacterium]